MKNSAIPVAMMAAAMMLGASSAAYAAEHNVALFGLVPANPPLNGKVDCSDVFGGFMDLRPKNLGQELTIFKAFNGANFSLRTAFLFEEEFDPDNFDNVGDILKNEMENICNIGPNN